MTLSYVHVHTETRNKAASRSRHVSALYCCDGLMIPAEYISAFLTSRHDHSVDCDCFLSVPVINNS